MAAGGDVIIYLDPGEGECGTPIAQATDVAHLDYRPVGWENTFELTLDLEGQSFSLPVGRYHVGIRPVGTGMGQAFALTTSGRFAVGSPIHNGNCFFQSDLFGYPLPTNWENVVGPGTWDVSFGLECAGDYTLNVEGNCASNITISWAGARANERQVIIFSPGLGSAPIGGVCGTIPSGLASVELFLPTFGTGPTGIGHVRGYVFWRACDKRIQLVTYTGGPCITSNVVQIHEGGFLEERARLPIAILRMGRRWSHEASGEFVRSGVGVQSRNRAEHGNDGESIARGDHAVS